MKHIPGPLSAADLEQFVTQGYVLVRAGIPKDTAVAWGREAYTRLGYDPVDSATWKESRLHMPGRREVPVAELAPKAWDAIVQLCGGEERIRRPATWSDAFIANFSEGADQPWRPPSPDCPGWHKDGDFFRHFLDSPEQGLLVIPLWTDVVHQGGPTYLATDSVPVVARFLADRPEGVLPNEFGFKNLISQCRAFAEATGEAGDVYILHPFVLHTVSQNMLRAQRVITNPPLALAEPMRFDRGPAETSPIEAAVLHGLGVETLDFRPTRPRETFRSGSADTREAAGKLEVG